MEIRLKLLKFNTIYALDGDFSNDIEGFVENGTHFRVIRPRTTDEFTVEIFNKEVVFVAIDRVGINLKIKTIFGYKNSFHHNRLRKDSSI